MKIKIIGLAKTEFEDIKQLDGIDCQDDFVDYLDNEVIADKLESGYMYFSVIDNNLYTITEYELKENEELTLNEMLDLAEYTQGQWSDGIGEGFEQFPCIEIDDEEVYISPWSPGQKLIILKEE